MMKNLLSSFTLLFIIITNFSAQVITETYYKDPYFKKEVELKKANYKIKKVEALDTTIHFFKFSLNDNILMSEEVYKADKPFGIWKNYNASGKLTNEVDFSKLVYLDSLVNDSLQEVSKVYFDDTLGNFILPFYGSSELDIRKYLVNELKYPQIALENNISGKVYIRFIVEKNGNVVVHSIAKSQHPFLDYEAWRVIEKMSNWNPGTYKGKTVDCYFILPISFILM